MCRRATHTGVSLLLAGVCSGAVYGPVFRAMAKGNPPIEARLRRENRGPEDKSLDHLSNTGAVS